MHQNHDTCEHIWLPYTQMKTAAPPLLAKATLGSRIILDDARELIDGIASWWTACHGYNHPHILKAMREQMERMPHVMFGGIVHEPALKLAKRLAGMVPMKNARVFFADSGSVAVEVALKMAAQFWLNNGCSGRVKFVGFRHGYHGDTMACMSLCDPVEGMHARFKGYLPEQFVADLPQDDATTEALDDLLRRERHNIAAVIIEPLAQGAGGMKFHSPETLRRVAALCREHGVLLIADEIMTGFGRTGTMFASSAAGISPDIMCVGKALTGGAITLAATLASEDVFGAFWSDKPEDALMHGPTYMANPLACAAANASLDLFESEPRLLQVEVIESLLRKELEPCRGLPNVVDVRVMGAIGAVQLREPMDIPKLKRSFIERGVWIRPFGDIIYLTPAFTITDDELGKLTEAVCAAITVPTP